MSCLTDINFVVTDIETTGSNPHHNRMTEVASVVVRNGEIIEQFSSLINPHQFIPPYISKMTGITNEMAFRAPESYDVFPKFRKLFDYPDTVFVAHNANFDFSFINATFQREGINQIDASVLCTLKLAKRLLPNNQKKNLGAVSNHFGIKIRGRHRALGDAEATAYVLIEFLEMLEFEYGITTLEELLKFQNKKISNFKPPDAVVQRLQKRLAELPDSPGVYYFKNKRKNILYIGKAKSLKERVSSYFISNSLHSKKVTEMLRRTFVLDWVTTDTELEALILESKEIKIAKPYYNLMQKKYRHYPFIKLTTNEAFPRVMKSFNIEDDGAEYFGPFRSSFFVDEIIESIEKKYKLRKCGDNFKPAEHKSPCLYHHLNMCDAPCNLSQNIEKYAEEVNKVRFFLSGFGDGIIVKLQEKMLEFAEKMEFEAADKVKRQINQLKVILSRDAFVPASINNNNLILSLPLDEREKTVQTYFFKSGKLIKQAIYGRLAPLGDALDFIHHTYYNGTAGNGAYTLEDIDEVRIVNSWLYKNRGFGTFIYLDGKNENQINREFEDSVRNVKYENQS